MSSRVCAFSFLPCAVLLFPSLTFFFLLSPSSFFPSFLPPSLPPFLPLLFGEREWHFTKISSTCFLARKTIDRSRICSGLALLLHHGLICSERCCFFVVMNGQQSRWMTYEIHGCAPDFGQPMREVKSNTRLGSATFHKKQAAKSWRPPNSVPPSLYRDATPTKRQIFRTESPATDSRAGAPL